MTTKTQAKRTEGELSVLDLFVGGFTLHVMHGRVEGVPGEQTTVVAQTTGNSPADLANAEYIRKAWNCHGDSIKVMQNVEAYFCEDLDYCPVCEHHCGTSGHFADCELATLLAKAQQ